MVCNSFWFITDVKQYPNLIKTLCFLLNSYKARETASTPPVQGKYLSCKSSLIFGLTCENQCKLLFVFSDTRSELPRPAFLMSWRRRIGKQDESLFFTGCETAGLQVKHLGSRVYCITPSKLAIDRVKHAFPEPNSG